MWRIGPVVYDWSGYFGVVRCECGLSYGPSRDPRAVALRAREHARDHHGVPNKARVAIPELLTTDREENAA